MQCKEFSGIDGTVTYTEAELGWDPSAYSNHSVVVDGDDATVYYVFLRMKGATIFGLPTFVKLTDPNAGVSHFAFGTVDAGVFDAIRIVFGSAVTSATVAIQSFNEAGDARL